MFYVLIQNKLLITLYQRKTTKISWWVWGHRQVSEQEDTSVLGPGGAVCPAGPPPGRVQHVRHYLALEACCCADYQSVLEDRGPLEQSSSHNDRKHLWKIFMWYELWGPIWAHGFSCSQPPARCYGLIFGGLSCWPTLYKVNGSASYSSLTSWAWLCAAPLHVLSHSSCKGSHHHSV